MEKDKSRGLKHVRDKRKYKGNTTKDPKHVPIKSKRNLESNWDRYEKEDVQDFQLDSSTDFSILASAPIVQGQHFQSKRDKMIAEEIEHKISNPLFSLDLNLLNYSILTVPFYRRVGIEQEYFIENQIKFMNKDAEDSWIKFNEKEVDKEIINESVELTCKNNTKDQSVDIAKEEEKDLDDFTELITKVDGVEKLEKATPKRLDDDLEQWLDDILDD